MVTYLLSGRLKVSKDRAGRALVAGIDPNDLRELTNWYIVVRPWKYRHIPEIRAAVSDYRRQMVLWS